MGKKDELRKELSLFDQIFPIEIGPAEAFLSMIKLKNRNFNFANFKLSKTWLYYFDLAVS